MYEVVFPFFKIMKKSPAFCNAGDGIVENQLLRTSMNRLSINREISSGR